MKASGKWFEYWETDTLSPHVAFLKHQYLRCMQKHAGEMEKDLTAVKCFNSHPSYGYNEWNEQLYILLLGDALGSSE